jgi:dihydroxyacetone kinase-like protein
MRRGFEAVLAAVDELSAKDLGESLKGVGTTLVMKVGGASGPLYGTLFMSLGKSLADEVTSEQVADAFAAAIEAVKARGKSDVGQKTLPRKRSRCGRFVVARRFWASAASVTWIPAHDPPR